MAIQNSAFSYFNGTNGVPMPAILVANLDAWCGILSQAQLVQDVRVATNTFNGNMSQQSVTDYAADGLVWLSTGGQFSVEANSITNYHLEAVQLNSGPYTVVGNVFNTSNTCPSSCALNTSQDYNGSTISSPNSINSTYCFVANVVNGTGGGWGIRNPGDIVYGPFNIVASANQFSEFMYPSGSGPSQTIGLSTCQNASITANQLVQGERAVCYQDGPLWASTQSCNVYALCNDFSAANFSSFFVQDGGNKLYTAKFQANRLGCGWDYSSVNNFGTHIGLGLPTTPATPPQIILRGNQFMSWSPVNSPLISPSISGVNLNGTITANNLGTYVGCGFTVGNGDLIATHLGRWVFPQDTGSHVVGLFDGNGNPISGAATTVNTSGATPNQFTYGMLTTPVRLVAGTTYRLASAETVGGDLYYNNPQVTTSGVTMIGSYWYNGAWYWVGGSTCLGPVNFLCCLIYPAPGSTQYVINSADQFADSTFSLF